MKKSLTILFLLLIGVILVGCQSTNVEDPTIKVYTRDTTSGTRDGFFTNINFKEAIADNTVLVKGYVELSGNGDVIQAINNDEFGIGYISLSSLSNSKLKGLIYNGVEPTEQNVLNGTYLLTRNFNYAIRTNYDVEAEQKIVNAFLAYLSTKEGKATIKGNDGIVELHASDPSWNDIKGLHPIHLEDNSSITIKFGGSTSVEKIAKALASEFSQRCGNFKFENNHTGSGDAYKRTQGSEKDGANKLHIAFSSREFKLTENEPFAKETYGKICIDAIVAVVNSKNRVDHVTSEILKKVFDGSITKWKGLE